MRTILNRMSVIALMLIGAGALLHGAVLTVGVWDDYETISEALKDADVGDTIQVSEELYELDDPIEINVANLVLEGEDARGTILDGKDSVYAVIKVKAPGVTIRNFTIRRGSSHGIYISDDNWAMVENNIICDNGDRGILLGMGAPYAILTNNTIVNNKVSALYSYRDDARTKLVNNIIAHNGRGIVTDSARIKNMTISNNCFWGQGTDTTQAKLGKGNFTADPMFAGDKDFRLLPGSPCIGKGTNRETVGALGVNSSAKTPAPVPSVKEP